LVLQQTQSTNSATFLQSSFAKETMIETNHYLVVRKPKRDPSVTISTQFKLNTPAVYFTPCGYYVASLFTARWRITVTTLDTSTSFRNISTEWPRLE
jgi:hypothetical protein